MTEKQRTLSDSQAEVRRTIEINSEFDVAFLAMNGLATVVASYGLFENSPAVVIGAMIIAMLLGPIYGVGLGLVDKNDNLLRKAVFTLAGGIAVVYGVALIIGATQHQFPLTDEIYARTAPNLMDLMIALGGGAAGAYAMITPRLSAAFVGVAIATALVPPLAARAICLSRGEYRLAFGALLLALSNIVAIQVACSLVMWFGGYRGVDGRVKGGELKRNLVSVALLIILGVVLSLQLRQLIGKELYQASVRRILQAASATHKGAYLTDVRFRHTSFSEVVTAVYRTPSPFTPEEAAGLEPKLPLASGTTNLELRIRSIPITIASKQGYLYSDREHD